MAESVKALVENIKNNLSQTNSSKKDEIAVMRAMLSDDTYEVGVYGKDGLEGTYCPAKDFKNMCSSIISSAAKITQSEAVGLMENYEVSKSEATAMVNISKEYVNTFLNTGRKFPLGGREKSDVSLSLKEIPEGERRYPKKVGVNDDGTNRYAGTPTKVNAHNSIRVHAPCPSWIKD